MYKAQIIPAIFFNLEGWTNIGKSDWERLEAIQGKILRGILGVPQSTPYWGMLHELDIIPVKLLTYKRMMVYHNIINSDEERIVRTILLKQERYGHKECWAGNAKEEGEEIGVEIRADAVQSKPKSIWKKEVKKISEAFNAQMEEEKREKKMRFLKSNKGIEKYLSSCKQFRQCKSA